MTEEGWYFIQDTYTDNSVTPPTEDVKGVGILVGTSYDLDGNTYTQIKNDNGELETLSTADAKTDDPNQPDPEVPPNPADAEKNYHGSIVPGSTVEFQLTSDVPNYAGLDLDTYVYNYIDTFESGWDPEQIKITSITVGGDEFVGANNTVDPLIDVVLPADADGKAGEFQVKFGALFTSLLGKEETANDPNKADDAKYEGKKIVVTYTMTAKTDATTANLANDFNIYDNGHKIPGEPVDPENPNPNKVVKVTDGFLKVGPDGKALNGAKFTMTYGDSTVTVTSGDLNGDGAYDEKDKDINGDGTVGADEAKLDTTGWVVFHNVEVGLWLVNEGTTAAADLQAHYNEMSDLFDLVTFGDDDAATSEDSQSVKVKNVTSLTQLPLTGAAGVILFVLVAALLAGGAVTMVMISKRNQKAALAI